MMILDPATLIRVAYADDTVEMTFGEFALNADDISTMEIDRIAATLAKGEIYCGATFEVSL